MKDNILFKFGVYPHHEKRKRYYARKEIKYKFKERSNHNDDEDKNEE
ncbi:MAG: hypothetical protein MUO96_05955 [Actinobacteria bacterium]|nr:hypothetical protein [Actinomycetota bacterium]